MRTQVVNSSNANAYASSIGEVAAALRDGALVVFPTETVYGIAANAASPEAMRRLRDFKAANDQRPFTVHLGRRTDAASYVSTPAPVLRRFARKAWPGPLTLIAEEPSPEQTRIAGVCPREQLGEIFHAGTVALRYPDHAAAQRLLGEAGVPVVASSANLHGQKPPVEFEAALRACEGRADYAIDARRTRCNTASSVVEVRGQEWRVRRQGAIDERTLRRLSRSLVLMVCTGNSCRSPMAEYLFLHKLAERLDCTEEELRAAGYDVASAGTAAYPGGMASSGSLNEMARRGIDISGHQSQPLTVELIQRAERIYVMSPEHRSMALERVPGAAGRVELLDPDGPVVDPIGGGADEYQQCAVHIERAVEARLKEFLDEDRNW